MFSISLSFFFSLLLSRILSKYSEAQKPAIRVKRVEAANQETLIVKGKFLTVIFFSLFFLSLIFKNIGSSIEGTSLLAVEPTCWICGRNGRRSRISFHFGCKRIPRVSLHSLHVCNWRTKEGGHLTHDHRYKKPFFFFETPCFF